MKCTLLYKYKGHIQYYEVIVILKKSSTFLKTVFADNQKCLLEVCCNKLLFKERKCYI